MQSVWYQVEFYSELEQRWVPLFGKCATVEAARQEAIHLREPKRVVRVTVSTEVVSGK